MVVYDALIHPDLLAEVRPDAERVYVGKRGYCVGSTLQETINDVLANRARQGLTVVRLKGGDPCVFGRGGEEAEYLAEHGIPFEIVPGVTTAVGACAAGEHPAHAPRRGAVGRAGHRPLRPRLARLHARLVRPRPDEQRSSSTWACGTSRRSCARLIDAGMPPDTPAAVVANATLPDQVVIDSPLSLTRRRTREPRASTRRRSSSSARWSGSREAARLAARSPRLQGATA